MSEANWAHIDETTLPINLCRRWSSEREHSPNEDCVGVIFAWPPEEWAANDKWADAYRWARDVLLFTPKEQRRDIRSTFYRLHPHRDYPHYVKNEPAGRAHFRGSCVGFVIQCLESAGIKPFLSETGLPTISAAHAPSLLGGWTFVKLARHKKVPDKPDAEGDDETQAYRIMLPGYLLAALDAIRASDALPFQPTSHTDGVVDTATWDSRH